MLSSILILFAMPWLDSSKIRSLRYRPLSKFFFWMFVADAILLGYIGSQPADGALAMVGSFATLYYFTHFLIIIPLTSRHEKTCPLPESINESCNQNCARS